MIATGHPVDAVWSYSLRQMNGFLFLMEKRKLRDQLNDLKREWMAAQGDPKVIKKQIATLSKEL